MAEAIPASEDRQNAPPQNCGSIFVPRDTQKKLASDKEMQHHTFTIICIEFCIVSIKLANFHKCCDIGCAGLFFLQTKAVASSFSKFLLPSNAERAYCLHALERERSRGECMAAQLISTSRRNKNYYFSKY